MRKLLSDLTRKIRALYDRFVDCAWEDWGWFTFTTSTASLKELWEQNRDLFLPHQDFWWKDAEFAVRSGIPRRIRLRVSAVRVQVYFNKTLDEQWKLLKRGEFVLTARDLVEGKIAYYRAYGERLLPDCGFRTIDIASDGNRAIVGFRSVPGGGHYWDDERGPNLGLAVARTA